MDTNVLYYGDNLTILHSHIADELVDVIYMNLPFQLRTSHIVLFAKNLRIVASR